MGGFGWGLECQPGKHPFPSACQALGCRSNVFAYSISSFVDKIHQPWNLCPCISLKGMGSHHRKIFKLKKITTV